MSERVEEVKTEKHPKTQTQRKPFLIPICKAYQMKAKKTTKATKGRVNLGNALKQLEFDIIWSYKWIALRSHLVWNDFISNRPYSNPKHKTDTTSFSHNRELKKYALMCLLSSINRSLPDRSARHCKARFKLHWSRTPFNSLLWNIGTIAWCIYNKR